MSSAHSATSAGTPSLSRFSETDRPRRLVSSVNGSVSDSFELSWSNQKPNCSAGRMHTVTSKAMTARDTATCSPNSGSVAASHTAMPTTETTHQPMWTRCSRGPWKNTT